ncbi:MAG: hypothetical protein HYY16_07450 [Planctomycetes bacterium]|nr:hypothetical protein [Planctomycetota bacterium]
MKMRIETVALGVALVAMAAQDREAQGWKQHHKATADHESPAVTFKDGTFEMKGCNRPGCELGVSHRLTLTRPTRLRFVWSYGIHSCLRGIEPQDCLLRVEEGDKVLHEETFPKDESRDHEVICTLIVSSPREVEVHVLFMDPSSNRSYRIGAFDLRELESPQVDEEALRKAKEGLDSEDIERRDLARNWFSEHPVSKSVEAIRELSHSENPNLSAEAKGVLDRWRKAGMLFLP